MALDVLQSGEDSAGMYGDDIECIVDFDRTKMLGVKVEHALFGQVIGIKAAFPLFVGITTGADVEIHRTLNSTS